MARLARVRESVWKLIMKIWIIHQHAIPPSKPGHTRPYDYARALKQLGHEVFIISSSFNHVQKQHEWLGPGERFRLIDCDGVPFLWIKTPGYAGNTVGRVVDMIAFAGKLWLGTGQRLLPKPDLIIGSSPPPFAALSGLLVARRFVVPFILDIRDLWPETLVRLGGYSKINPFVVVLKVVELVLYRKSDYITTVLPNAIEYMTERGGNPNRVIWLPNGVDSQWFSKTSSGFQRNVPFVVLYAGAHGIANALDSIVYAAHLLQEEGYTEQQVLFKFIGEGPEKRRLIALSETYNLKNIVFEAPVPKKDIFAVLESADALIVTLKNSDLYRYGMSLNKLHDYMAAGKPVIFGAAIDKNPVEEASAGITVPPEDGVSIALAVKKLRESKNEELIAMGDRGRQYVLSNHDMKILGVRLEKIIRNAVLV